MVEKKIEKERKEEMYKDAKQMLSDSKFYEGYSRYIEDKGRYETWDEAVDRVMEMHKIFYKDKLTPELLSFMDEAASAYKKKKVLGSQRTLQFGGEQLLKNHAKQFNCVFSYADRPEFFGESFFLLLSGCGVGFSVQKHHVAKLPKINNRTKNPKIHVVDDSIEGWATSVDVLLSSFFELARTKRMELFKKALTGCQNALAELKAL
jgi:ribonucleoside-diphosphate reductase alpha chain